MECREKTEVHRACISAWESYETRAREAGNPIVAQGVFDLSVLNKLIAC